MIISNLRRVAQVLLAALAALTLLSGQQQSSKEKHFLYVASPGIRNYEEHGGVGVLVFDIDDGYKLVKRIPTWDVPAGQKPENVKGIAANARTGRVYVTSLNRMIALDAVSGKKAWDKTYEGGCDRMAISPDGNTLYVPQLEGPFWTVVKASNGDVITKIETKSGSHNTIYSNDGAHVYMAGLKSPLLSIADTKKHQVASKVGPFSNVIRPFTVNGSNTLVFVNINGLLGFEIGDIRTGKMLHRVEVQGYKQGPVKRHGCPSHGIALTADEKELWVVDGANNFVHIFDATVMPPKQTTSVKLRDSPGWMSFSIDGKFAYSSTGEILDVATKKVVAALQDETGRQVQSEKVLDMVIAGGKVVRAGNQFGVGIEEVIGILICLLIGAASARDSGKDDARFFDKRVAPILTRRCLGCHNEELKDGNISFLDRGSLLKGGSHGPAVVPGNPEASLLIHAIRRNGDLKMPPGPPLSPQEIATLTAWIQRGAPWGTKLRMNR